MKIQFFLLFIIFNINLCFGQDYLFNKLVENEFSTKHFPNQKHINLFNSEDYSYHMLIYNLNDSIFSRIFDTKKEVIHDYYCKDKEFLKFQYIQSSVLEKNETIYEFQFSEIKNKRDTKRVIFKILNSKGKRIGRYKLEVQNTEENMLPIFSLSATEVLLFSKIIPPKNFMVLKAQGLNTNSRYVEYKLQSIKDIDLSISVSK